MAQVEQAIFTSARTDRSAGYQVVARSPGVSPADAGELRMWGPSHDSLLELGPEATSLNFHPLPSGAYCVSRTTAAGFEYSGRGGHRVYTQCLIVPPDVLERFANNPFKLIKAAQAGGMLEIHDRVPRQLEPRQFAGRAAPVDQDLLTRLASELGPPQLAMLVQVAMDSICLAMTGPPSAAELIAGLFSCLPVECRTEFSFSTGLKFSSRRPFRIVTLSDDRAEQRWIANQNSVTVLNLADGPAPDSIPIDGWAQLIKRVISSGQCSFLAGELSKQHGELTSADISALGLQLLEDFDASALCNTGCNYAESDGPNTEEPVDDLDDRQRADAAHDQFAGTSGAATAEKLKANAPSKTLHPDSPKVRQKLELLDDVVYEAINGQATALQRLEALWPEILNELSDEMIAESCAQYLRYALTIWEECVKPGNVRNPARAVQALDVLCMLFNEA